MDAAIAHAASQREWVIGPCQAWTVTELAMATAALTGLYLAIFAWGMAVLPATDRRRRSWILTTVSSTGTSLAGMYYGYRVLRDGLATVFAEDAFTNDYGLSVLTCLFFAVYLVLDLVLGTIFYREQMTFLSGWLHHSIYLGILYYFNYKLHLWAPFSAFLLSEIPTAIMSYGQLDKTWRSDILFGATYLVTRLIYHGYLLALFLENWSPGWTAIAGTLVMHVHWFRLWVVSQRKKGVLKNLEDRWRGRSSTPAPAKAD